MMDAPSIHMKRNLKQKAKAMPILFPAKKIVIASHNQGKTQEIAELLVPYGIETASAYELGLEDVEENGTTFAENATLKAVAAATATGLPALSDDSGLCAEALEGAPGIYSARWAEREDGTRDFSYGIEKLEKAIVDQVRAGDGRNDFDAYFIAMLCLAMPNGDTHLFEGRVNGHLEFPPRGTKGFGYDPIFVADGEEITYGEMEPSKKHAISHRAIAFAKFVEMCFE